MTTDSWTNDSAASRTTHVFFEAIEIEGDDERSAFLERACADNHILRQEIESMLRSHAAAEDLFEDDQHLWISAGDLYDAIIHVQSDLDASNPGKRY